MNPQAPVSRVFSSPLSDEQPSRVPQEGRAPERPSNGARVEIFIPRVAAWLTTNSRDHWAVTNKRTQTWRKAAWAMTKAARLEPIAGPVHVTATIHKTTRHKYDLDGHTPTVKACIDGIRQAGLLPEDDTTVIPQLTIRAGEQRTRAGIHFTIEETQ